MSHLPNAVSCDITKLYFVMFIKIKPSRRLIDMSLYVTQILSCGNESCRTTPV